MEGLNEGFNAAQFLVEALKDGQRLPVLTSGLCWLLSDEDEWQEMYDGFAWLFHSEKTGFVSPEGEWNEARMNLLALLAVMDEFDFE